MTNSERYPPLFLHLIPCNLSFNYLLKQVNYLIFGFFIGFHGSWWVVLQEHGVGGVGEIWASRSFPHFLSPILKRQTKSMVTSEMWWRYVRSAVWSSLFLFWIADANWGFLSKSGLLDRIVYSDTRIGSFGCMNWVFIWVLAVEFCGWSNTSWTSWRFLYVVGP